MNIHTQSVLLHVPDAAGAFGAAGASRGPQQLCLDVGR